MSKELHVIVVKPNNYPFSLFGKLLCLLLPSTNIHRTVINMDSFIANYRKIVKDVAATKTVVVYMDCEKNSIVDLCSTKQDCQEFVLTSSLVDDSQKYGPVTLLAETTKNLVPSPIEDQLGLERLIEDTDFRFMSSYFNIVTAEEAIEEALSKVKITS